ncbi:ACP S-malonyltransferase [Streptomyces angustmyceticus]|uniref:ACP S-malonyltransferase n=1 Tax=Streptomyces angustmyceticus TaxID=285578 RepID=UPI001180C21A|nr:ACP S-malonyltransferase [Streptomyces angustmyceticus]UAL66014.1 ACP S-malonyltransferase [Streptomyces angustmyceticus]
MDDEIRRRGLSKSMNVMLDLASDTLAMDFRSILRNGTEEEVNDPRFRRPLINLMGVAGYQQDLRSRDIQPVCVTGMSLGFLSAAAAVGWVSLEDMVRTSHLMASIETEVFADTDYVSVFFYNCDPLKVFEELRAQGLDSLLHLAATVSCNQFLGACRLSDIDAMKPALIKAGAFYKAIPYSFPGHCALMETVRKRFADEWEFRAPHGNTAIPLVSINDCRPYTSGETIRQHVIDQFTTVLDWRGVIRYLTSLQLDTYIVLEPSAFVVKSLTLDPEYELTPVTGGVTGDL